MNDEQLDWALKGLAAAEALATRFPDYPHQLLEAMRKYCDGLKGGEHGEPE
jgi:hypothetical protein